MDEYIENLKQTQLFADMEPQDIGELLECLCVRYADYAKGGHIIGEGDRVCDFGIMLSGHGQAVKWDMSGRQIIITLLKKGSEIGVILAAASDRKSPVTVQALEGASVLWIPFERVLTRCQKDCLRHDRLLRNYIRIVAEKGLLLHDRINCLVRPSIREKIMTYLLKVSREQQGETLTLPLNRNSMAEYLNVERSALSRELSNMKQEGILDYYKNTFRLIKIN